MGRGSETQLQVSENLNSIASRFKAEYNNISTYVYNDIPQALAVCMFVSYIFSLNFFGKEA